MPVISEEMILYLVLVIISLLVYVKVLKRSVQRIPGDKGKYILVTGCDSGFGRDAAIRLDSLGFSVFATCLTQDGESSLRNSCSKNLDVIRLDITDSSQVKAAYDLVKKTMPSDTGTNNLIYHIFNLSSSIKYLIFNNSKILHFLFSFLIHFANLSTPINPC